MAPKRWARHKAGDSTAMSDSIEPPRLGVPGVVAEPAASSNSRQNTRLGEGAPVLLKAVDLGEGAPVGLKAVELPERVTLQALREVRPHVPSRSQNQVELQWSFGHAVSEGVLRIEHKITSFPAVSSLMQMCMASLGFDSDLDPDTLNVIIRRYSQGQGIAWHTDRIDYFEEPVFGCVLLTKAKQGLQFRRPAHDEFAPRYTLPEQMGVAFSMTGQARYDWGHGIEEIDSERISVTWRWFKASYMADTPGEHKPEIIADPVPVFGDEKMQDAPGSAQLDGHAEESPVEPASDEVRKERLKIEKQLREIVALQQRADRGENMQQNQLQKISKRQDVERRLLELGQ